MQRHVSVVHVVMGWSWVSLSTLPPATAADPSLAPAAVLLQMKLQADERQRWGGLPLDQQLPDHQQGVPEEALPPASLLFSQCGRQEDGDVHHEEDGGTGGRVETRVCAGPNVTA